jgi:hypothetical protein
MLEGIPDESTENDIPPDDDPPPPPPMRDLDASVSLENFTVERLETVGSVF